MRATDNIYSRNNVLRIKSPTVVFCTDRVGH